MGATLLSLDHHRLAIDGDCPADHGTTSLATGQEYAGALLQGPPPLAAPAYP